MIPSLLSEVLDTRRIWHFSTVRVSTLQALANFDYRSVFCAGQLVQGVPDLGHIQGLLVRWKKQSHRACRRGCRATRDNVDWA